MISLTRFTIRESMYIGDVMTKYVCTDNNNTTEDAQLIAAAPKLLEACRLALVELEKLDRKHSKFGGFKEPYASIAKAIEKAEGK